MDVVSAAFLLFLIMDPIGNVPAFLALLKDVAPTRRKRVLVCELVAALLILLAFLFLGQYLLDLFQLQQESISIAGGIVLFIIALRMIFPSRGVALTPSDGEPFLVPLAVPLIAGPSTIATLLLLVRAEPERILQWLVALLAAWGLTAAILLLASDLNRFLGERGLAALERLMGMLLVVMAVQMFLNGVATFMAAHGS